MLDVLGATKEHNEEPGWAHHWGRGKHRILIISHAPYWKIRKTVHHLSHKLDIILLNHFIIYLFFMDVNVLFFKYILLSL